MIEIEIKSKKMNAKNFKGKHVNECQKIYSNPQLIKIGKMQKVTLKNGSAIDVGFPAPNDTKPSV